MGKPKIRFEGYSEDWEQRKLSDYLSVSGQKNRDEKYDKEDVLSVSGDYGIVNQIEFQGRSFAGASVTNYGVVETNDVVYTKSPLKANPYGIIKSNKGKPGIVSTLYAVYHPNDITDSEFVQVYFEQDARMNSYMHPLVNKGAKNDMKVSAENALKGEVIFPKLDEQRQISDYFRRLDTIITLHQRKCDEIKTLKKYMLQKMFSQNGEKVPEIRFNGFTEDWEQRKLGDITTKIGSGKTPKGGAAAYKDDGIALIRSQNVNGDRVDLSDVVFIDEQTDEDMKNSRVLKGDVLLNITGASIGRSAVFTRELRANVNQHVCIIRTKGSDASPEFIQLNIISSNGQNQIDSFQAGGGREGLNFHQIGKMEFLYPGIEEQQKIGQYFANLDHLITLHQRKCNELKEIKKYMLQNMFV